MDSAAELWLRFGVDVFDEVCRFMGAGVRRFARSPADPRPSRPDRFVNKESVDKALSTLRTGTIEGVDMELLGKAKAVETIPYLEKEFARIDASFPNAETDEAMSETFRRILDKAKIAQVLIKLGDAKEQYWTYLAEHVKPGFGAWPEG